jgi:hypothetical protein
LRDVCGGFYAYDDHYDFGVRIGLMETRIRKVLGKYRIVNRKVQDLLGRSFLGDEAKALYSRRTHSGISRSLAMMIFSEELRSLCWVQLKEQLSLPVRNPGRVGKDPQR